MYKVEYYTESGTPSDNEFIGIYTTPEEAADAKQRYLNDNCGPNPGINDPDYHDWLYEMRSLRNCVIIQQVTNMY